MIIEWRGKIGYGDAVSPLCYAQNKSEILGETVYLNFHWEQSRCDESERIDALLKRIDFPGVSVDHVFNSRMHIDHTVYDVKAMDESQKFHNVYFPVVDRDPNVVVVCSPLGNLSSLAEYGKPWKDGLTKDEWRDIVDQDGVIHVDYRTPVDELLDALSQCSHFIGYHGSCSWVARLFGAPMTVYSKNQKFSRWAFPWCNGAMSVEEARIERDEFIAEGIRRIRR